MKEEGCVTHHVTRDVNFLVPVWRFPRPSRSMHLVDVYASGSDHVTRYALTERNNEA